MPRVILFLFVLAVGALLYVYYGHVLNDVDYGSDTATLLEQLENLPPTAAGKE